MPLLDYNLTCTDYVKKAFLVSAITAVLIQYKPLLKIFDLLTKRAIITFHILKYVRGSKLKPLPFISSTANPKIKPKSNDK